MSAATAGIAVGQHLDGNLVAVLVACPGQRKPQPAVFLTDVTHGDVIPSQAAHEPLQRIALPPCREDSSTKFPLFFPEPQASKPLPWVSRG